MMADTPTTETHSTYYAFWNMCYKNNWVTIDMLKEAVGKALITADEFKETSGQEYVA